MTAPPILADHPWYDSATYNRQAQQINAAATKRRLLTPIQEVRIATFPILWVVRACVESQVECAWSIDRLGAVAIGTLGTLWLMSWGLVIGSVIFWIAR